MRVAADSYLFEMIHGELADVVGRDHVSTTESDKIAYSCDYYWITRDVG